MSGKAADGYLVGANVCLDLNANMACDTNEPSAQTLTGGVFTLTIPNGVDAAAHPIVVQVSASTIDQDTGAAVGKPYVLSAPAGEPDFVSPLTTVVHGMLLQNPSLSIEDVETQVKLAIGAGAEVSLFADYVAAEDAGNSTADDYERLHLISQVAAKALAESHEVVMAAAASQNVDATASSAELIALVTNAAIDNLAGAALAVDQAGDSFNIAAVTVTKADVTDLGDQVEQAAAAASATPTSIQSLLTQGVYWIWADEEDDEFEYGRLAAGTEAGRLTERFFYYDETTWVESTGESADEASAYLTASGWVETPDTAENFRVTYQAEGSAILNLGDTGFTLKYTASEIDVAGKPIKDYLRFEAHTFVADSISGAPVFSSGAKAYQVNFIANTDAYVIDKWMDDCEAQYADPNGDCNVVFGPGSGSSPAQTFAQMMYPSVEAAQTAAQQLNGNWFSPGEHLNVRLVQGGVMHIADYANQQQPVYAQGSWAFKTVHGQQIIMLTLPSQYTSRLFDDGQPFLAIRGGYVRRGEFLPLGTPDSFGEIQFNEVAFEDIQDASSIY